MTYTTNYNLNIVEGTDIVNPLTQLNPNFTSIDSIMKSNADAAVTPATCIKSGTLHTVTRSNTDAEMFIFTATGDWNLGDTMTVDGTPVTPVLPDGTGLLTGSYLINSEVLASIKGSKVTIYSNKMNVVITDSDIEHSAGVSVHDMLTPQPVTLTTNNPEITISRQSCQKIGNVFYFDVALSTSVNGASGMVLTGLPNTYDNIIDIPFHIVGINTAYLSYISGGDMTLRTSFPANGVFVASGSYVIS